MHTRVIVLGAGASYGHGVPEETRPPLGSGFFQGPIAQTILPDYIDLTEYLWHTLGLVDLASMDIEELAESIQGSWQLRVYEQQEIEDRFGATFRAGGPPFMLRGYIVDHISIATNWLTRHSCPFHEHLFRATLSPGDTVVDFNYDLIADVALKRVGLWEEAAGYFDLPLAWSPTPRPPVRLLKPHGSLNWFKRSTDGQPRIDVARLDDALRDDRHVLGIIPRLGRALGRNDDARGFAEAAAVDPSFLLPLAVLPASKKDFAELTFGEAESMWKQIRRSIEGASELIAVGYSFRDRHFNQLLLETLRQRAEPLKLLVVSPSELNGPAAQLLRAPNLAPTTFRGTFEGYVSSLERKEGAA